MKKRFFLCALTAATLLAHMGPASAQDEFKIGLILPLTGPFASNTGRQWPVGNEGRPSGCGFSTNSTAREPFAAHRSISLTDSGTSQSGIRVWGMKRSG